MDLQANLSPEEANLLLEVGLNVLLAKGIMPFTTDNRANIQAASSAVQ